MALRWQEFAVFAALATTACSLTDLDDLTSEPSGSGATSGIGSTGTAGSGGSSASSGGDDGGSSSSCSCVDEPPPGWQGPYAVYTQLADTKPTCPTGTSSATYFEGTPAAHSCSECTCGAPDVSCTAPALTCFPATGCTGPSTELKPSGSCGPVGNYGSCVVGAAVVEPGPCQPSGGLPQLEGWSIAHQVCDAKVPDAACPGGACVQTTGAGKICISRTGAAQCPPSWQVEDIAAWQTASDDRSCSACGCGPASGRCEGGNYKMGTSFICTATTTPGVCLNFGEIVFADLEPATPVPGSCDATSSQPLGSFQPAGPMTLCCK